MNPRVAGASRSLSRESSCAARVCLGHRGVVLVIVLIVVAVLALASYSFTSLMLAHSESTQITGRQVQASLLAASGVESLRAFLLQDAVTRMESGGLYDNPSFRGVLVLQDVDSGDQGKYTVLAPALDAEGSSAGVRYGLEDESARVNLNALLTIEKQVQELYAAADTAAAGLAAVLGEGSEALEGAAAAASSGRSTGGSGGSAAPASGGSAAPASGGSAGSASGGSAAPASDGSAASSRGGSSATPAATDGEGDSLSDQENLARDLLMALPGMTVEIADALLDWLDEDDEPREFGAEMEYYSALSPAYAPKNGPLETVEELLLVRGITPQLLFGYDVNRNGIVDAEEMAAAGELSGLPERGWSSYFTLHSKEQNVNSLGEPRIDLNGDDLQVLSDALSLVFPAEWVTYIIAYRQNGPYSGEEEGELDIVGELNLSQQGKAKLTQVLDLVGQKVQVTFQGAREPTILLSPFGEDVVSMGSYMPLLMDQVTIVADTTIPGRISLSQAPREVLLGIPGMSEEIVEQILSQRVAEPWLEDETQQHETWLLTNGIVTLEEMRTLMPFICAGGHVYRAQVVGYYESGQASARVEAILDATQLPPRVLLWRDISHLGRGYALETLGVGLNEGM